MALRELLSQLLTGELLNDPYYRRQQERRAKNLDWQWGTIDELARQAEPMAGGAIASARPATGGGPDWNWGTVDELARQVAQQERQTPPGYSIDPAFSRPQEGTYFGDLSGPSANDIRENLALMSAGLQAPDARSKLERIRAEAGGTPWSGEGGAITQAQDTDQYKEIQAANEAWMAGQPTRDAEFALQQALMRKDVEGARAAADALSSIGQAEYYREQPYSAARSAQVQAQARGQVTDADFANYLEAQVTSATSALTPEQKAAATQAVALLRDGLREEADAVLEAAGLYATGGLAPTQPTEDDLQYERGRGIY
jgi:hypothetical protein